MRTIVVGMNWVTKYFIADTLYNDGNFEEFIQVISPEPVEQFFESFPKLQEFQGDERLSYIQSTAMEARKDLKLDHVDSIYLDNNTDAIGFIEFLNDKKFTKRVVLASSWEVYGWKGRNKVPIDPRDECKPETSEGEVKLLEELSIEASNLNYVILRFSTIFGPYMPHDHELVKMCLEAMYQQDIIIRGVPARWLDLVYITEALPVINKALSTVGIDRQIFNVGGMHDIATKDQPKKNLIVNEKRVTDIVRSMRHLMGSESPIVFEPGVTVPQGKGFHSQLDIESTQKTFNYYPNFDSIKLGQFIWWCQSISDKTLRRTHDMEELYPSLDPKFLEKGDIQKAGESMNISQEQFEQQLTQATKLAKRDQKIEDVT